MLFYYLCDLILYEQFFWVKIQDVFSLVSIDEFTSAVRGYKNLIGFAVRLSEALRVAAAMEKKLRMIIQLEHK